MSEERWTICLGDCFQFDICKASTRRDPWSDEALNGTFPTKLAALDELIGNFEETRATLNAQIAKAKAARRRLRATLKDYQS